MEDLKLIGTDSKTISSDQGKTSSFMYEPTQNVKGIKMRVSVTVPGAATTGTQNVSAALSKVNVGGQPFDGDGLPFYSYVYLLRHSTYGRGPRYNPTDPVVTDEGTQYIAEYLLDTAFNEPTEIVVSWAGINAFASFSGVTQVNVGISLVAIVTDEPIVAYDVKMVYLDSSSQNDTVEEAWVISGTEISSLITDQTPNLPTPAGIQALESAYAAMLGGATSGSFGDTIEDPSSPGSPAYIWRIGSGTFKFSTNGTMYMLVTYK
jgi:hypothetical protein